MNSMSIEDLQSSLRKHSTALAKAAKVVVDQEEVISTLTNMLRADMSCKSIDWSMLINADKDQLETVLIEFTKVLEGLNINPDIENFFLTLMSGMAELNEPKMKVPTLRVVKKSGEY